MQSQGENKNLQTKGQEDRIAIKKLITGIIDKFIHQPQIVFFTNDDDSNHSVEFIFIKDEFFYKETIDCLIENKIIIPNEKHYIVNSQLKEIASNAEENYFTIAYKDKNYLFKWKQIFDLITVKQSKIQSTKETIEQKLNQFPVPKPDPSLFSFKKDSKSTQPDLNNASVQKCESVERGEFTKSPKKSPLSKKRALSDSEQPTEATRMVKRGLFQHIEPDNSDSTAQSVTSTYC